MTTSQELANLQWRGSGSAAPEDDESTDRPSVRGRVLMLVGSGGKGNRERLREYLAGAYELIEPDERAGSVQAFDLAIVDVANFPQWQDWLMDAKVRDEPTFLPVILIISRAELRHRLRHHWHTIDEFIVAPVDKGEFAERIAMLMRTRQLALSQRSRLMYLVTHDRVSGLPNKSLFMERLTHTIHDASLLGSDLQVMVVHVPLARIMQSMGHQGLDRAAILLSRQLQSLLGDEVTLARLTTEEWAVLYPPGTSMSRLCEVGRSIMAMTDRPLTINNENVLVSPRIGVAGFPGDAADALGVLNCAISALSKAHAVPQAPMFYSRDVQHRALRHIRTEARIHDALAQAQFELWFQPQVRLSDLKVTGVEALIRWRLPSGELVLPGEFLPVAEASDLIIDIDLWVLKKACAVMANWRDRPHSPDRIAINVSSPSLMRPGFIDEVFDLLDGHAIPPPSIELELTESSFLESSASCLDGLKRLRDYGASIAVDDFGTGYSSLSYLHRLPITTVKIDKSFVDDIHQNSTNAAITQAVVWLSQHFSLETIAEGVETPEQAAYLTSLGIDTAQGFLYARPMMEEDLFAWLGHHQGR